MQAPTQVWVSLLAEITSSAGLRRVDSHSHSGSQRLEITVQRFRAHRLDSCRKFVPKDKWTPNGRITNPRVLIRVKVAAANSRYAHTQQNLSRPGRPGVRHLLDTHVTRPMQSRGQHACGVGTRIDGAHVTSQSALGEHRISSSEKTAISFVEDDVTGEW
jgi:hypothetical protein